MGHCEKCKEIASELYEIRRVNKMLMEQNREYEQKMQKMQKDISGVQFPSN